MTHLSPFSTWSLKTKFALCSGALMFVFSVAFTTWTLRLVEDDVRSSVIDAQRALVRSTAGDIDDKIELRRDALATIAPLLAQAMPAPGPEMDAFFKPRPVLQKMFDAVLVVDASGQVVHDLPHQAADAFTGRSIADRDYFKQVMGGTALVISSPEKSLVGAEPFIVFAAPLRSRDGKVNGALLCTLSLTHPNFLGHLGTVRIGQDGYFSLIERSDKPVFVLHRQPDLIMTQPPGGRTNPVMAQALRGLGGTVEGSDALGVESLSSFMLLHSVPWVLVANYPTAEAFAGLRTRQREVLWVGFALFATASGLAWLMSAWLLRPLGQLRDVMVRHASNPGLPMPPDSFGSAELSALVVAYNGQAASRHEFENRLKASEQRMRKVTDNIPALIAQVDINERYTFVNGYVGRVFGGDQRGLMGRTLREAHGDEVYADVAPYVAQALHGQMANFEASARVRGQLLHYQASYVPDFDASGQVCGFYAMTFDISALKQAQALQARVEQRLRAITDNLPALIGYIDKDECYGFLNATFHTWLGIDPAAALGRKMVDVVGAAVYESRHERVRQCLQGARIAFETEADTLIGKKVLQIDYIPDFAPDGTITGIYTLSYDVTDLKNAQASLARLVRLDSLTGLHNRYQFNEALPLALARCARSGRAMALMFLDIDHFKQINDTFGHAAGDTVLTEFAQRLRRSVRSTDMLARLGGDEFVVILEALDTEADVQVVALKILAEINRPFDVEGRMLMVTTSLGIAFQTTAHVGAEVVLARADAALYQAKAAGRNNYCLSAA